MPSSNGIEDKFSKTEAEVNQKLDEMSRQLTIPRDRIQKLYDELHRRHKINQPQQSAGLARGIAYILLRAYISGGYPICLCPQCSFFGTDLSGFQNHLRDEHNWGPDDLDIVRRGFWVRKNNKGLDYAPKARHKTQTTLSF